MVSKKDAITLGLLAIGGVGAAMVVGGNGNGNGNGGSGAGMEGRRVGGILGSQKDYSSPGKAPTIYQMPAQPAVTFPEAPTFDLKSFLAPAPPPTPAPVSRGAAGVSSAGKKQVVYGGYKPTGQTYVFGGKAFEAQAAKEVTQLGYSPTLGAAFGISPAKIKKSTTKSKKTASQVKSSKKQVVYGGYKPTGQTYVFGGKAFEAQAAKEVTQLGYSPTLGAAFGISPAKIKKSTTKSKKTASQVKSSTAARRAAFKIVTRFSKKQPK